MPGTQERLKLLFDSDQPRLIGSDQPLQKSKSAWPSSFFSANPSSYTTSRPAARKSSNSSASTSSAVSTAPSTVLSRSSSDNDADSASSRSSAPPANPVPWVPDHLIMGTYALGYDLPCEFSFVDCKVRFAPDLHQEWIAHSASHFIGHSPPSRLVCTFCDTEFDSSGNNGDRMANYRRRMVHIGGHFWDRRSLDVNPEPANHIRPDYHLLDYMRQKNLIDEVDYQHLTQHSERPHCEDIRPLGFVPREVQAKRAREDRRPHDQAREDRQRRKEREGKEKSTHHRKGIR